MYIDNDRSYEGTQSTSEEANITRITPNPEETEEQIIQRTMIEQWYLFKRLFVRDDGLHTFHMGWYDSGLLSFVFDGSHNVATTDAVDDILIENALVYEGFNFGGYIKLIYYDEEEKIEIIDLLGLDEDYSGIYYLDKSSIVEPEFNTDSSIPIPEDSKIEVDRSWYKLDKVYLREDGKYTISTHWHDDDIKFVFSDGFVATGSNLYCDEFIDNDVLLYEDISDIGTIDIAYYFLEDKIYVVDSTDNINNHSGYYYPSN